MVQVKVTTGILEGEKVSNPYGEDFYSFKGIPYAEPPTGDLRFKAPKPKQPWEGVRDAKSCGTSALQIDRLSPTPTKVGDEDCLYLNVYTPEINPSKPLPVMVWVHGGGFVTGNGNDDIYGPQYLVKEGVILVTFNYRLDALGFLCLDTEDIPGNAGMKDQVEVLRWVNKNISFFGGDPKNVTIFGESTGGISVSTLMVSQIAKGLFKRVIAQSGTAITPGVPDYYARERALILAKKLGCQSGNDKEIYEFLKTVPADKLIGQEVPLTLLDANKKTIDTYFGIVIEKKFNNVEAFLNKDVCEALREREDAPEILLGTTEHEGTSLIFYDQDIENLPQRYNTFKELSVPKILLPVTTLSQQIALADQIKQFYFKKEQVTTKNLSNLLNFISFDMFRFPNLEWAKLCARKANRKVFLYKFTCKTDRNMMINFVKPEVKNIFGDIELVNHGDDLFYIFPLYKVTGDSKFGESAYKCVDNVVKLWTNFAKHGNPTPDNSLGVKWKPYTSEERNYLDIGNQLAPGVNLDGEELQFWEELVKKFGKQIQKYRLGLLRQ